MVADIKQNKSFGHDLAEWIGGLDGTYHKKLAKLGLVEPRQPAKSAAVLSPTIKQFTDSYIKEHSCGEQTRQNLELYARGLIKHFRPDKRLDSFNRADAERFRRWLETNGSEQKKYKKGLGPNTVRTRIRKIKQFFNFAVKDELIARNPFEMEKSADIPNDARMVEVLAAWIHKMIQAAPDEDFRLMLALARFGGLRRHELSIQVFETPCLQGY